MSMDEWWKNSVFYHIYPRSFLDSNQDGIGDIRGITHKIDYLVNLGIDAVWLSPIFPSPNHDFGYDILDYCGVDPVYGTEADLYILIAELKKRNIKIILDGVFNHTSIEHPWFTESSSRIAKEDWYIWREKPNNWTSAFGGSAWTWHPIRNSYYVHTFCPEQPDLNWSNTEVQKAILRTMEFWFQKGIDGFRLDVFNCYAKDNQLRNNPNRKDIFGRVAGLFYSFVRHEHIYDRDRDELFPILKKMRALADTYNAVLIGETLDEQLRYKRASAYVGPEKLHLAFHFQLLHTKWKPQEISSVCRQLQTDFATQWPTIVLSNHDFPRQSKRWGKSIAKRKVMTVLSLTFRGTPFVYYGEEIGLEHASIPYHALQDPVGKRFWPFYSGRDGARTPMQWNNEVHSGFSKHRPWLPTAANNTPNVCDQEQEKDSLLNLYKKLLLLRKQHVALQIGTLEWLPSEEGVLRYMRRYCDTSCTITINLTQSAKKMRAEDTTKTILFSLYTEKEHTLSAYGAIIHLNQS